MEKSFHTLSYIGLLTSALIWGSTFFIIKDSLHTINPVTLVTYRFSIAAILCAGIVLISKKRLWESWQSGFILGFLNWLVFIPQAIGLQFTTASNSGFITGLFILFVPIFGFLFFKKHSTYMQLIALGVALIGLWFLTGGFQRINIGDLLTLITAMAVALYNLMVDKFVKKNISPLTLNFQQFFTISLLSLGSMFIFHISPQVGSVKTVFAISYLAIFASITAYGIQLWAQKYTQPLTASLLMSMEPVFAALLAWTIGGEKVILMAAVGGLLIFTAIIISEIPLPRLP